MYDEWIAEAHGKSVALYLRRQQVEQQRQQLVMQAQQIEMELVRLDGEIAAYQRVKASGDAK